MKKLDLENVQEVGEFNSVVPGGYIAKIVSATDVPEKEYLKMELNIAEGDYKDYYKDLSESMKFWGLTLYRSYKESALGFFKAFKNTVEQSNDGFVYDYDEKTLEGKLVGIILGEEEYIGNDGSEKVRLKITSTKSVEDIKAGKFKIPKKKLLENSTSKKEESEPEGDTPF